MTVLVHENFDLKKHNSFGIDVSCRYFVEVTTLAQLQEVLVDPQWRVIPHMVLGEGSNVLFCDSFPGLIIKIALKGVRIITETENDVHLNVAAGENWHQFVLRCIKSQWSGIENLSLIPGSVGAAPIQNIGAYGVEFSEVVESVTAIDSEGEVHIFDKSACQFGYRRSIFKNECKNQFIVTSVNLRLSKKPVFRMEYGAIKETLEAMRVKQPSIQAISDAVIKIRQQKLPDPRKIGNAGSFFMSPVISKDTFFEISKKYPNIPYFPQENSQFKIPAGWLIEQCGWKGRRLGEAGVHEHHALVLVNYGHSSGCEVRRLAENIQADVKKKFNIELLPEVNIV